MRMARKIKKNYLKKVSLILFAFLFSFCNNPSFTPKPKGYPRIFFPEKSYIEYLPQDCPFLFDIPTYSTVIKDSIFFNEPVENPCWMNISFNELGATVYISYKSLNRNNIRELLEDMHKLTFKHSIKAEYIDDELINTSNNVTGIYYQVGGNAASPVQFFLTDSVQHYIRGALYFNTQPNIDSLRPVIDFVKTDINHLINTLKWK